MTQSGQFLRQEFPGGNINDSCLVLEGGGLRGAFTSGVLEFFLENSIEFPRVVGVSAGACNGASYMSRQIGRNWKVNVEAPSDKRFMGFSHLFRNGSYFNMEFIFNVIPNSLIPFDEKAFYQNKSDFDVVITSYSTGETVILTKNEIACIGLNKVLRATSSIPIISKPVNINGQYFYDGGVSDSIPVKYALEKHKKAVVILTQPRGYRKDISKNYPVYKLIFNKNPEFLSSLIKRNEDYNITLNFCDKMEKEGRLFIIAPSSEFSVKRNEPSFEKRARLYHHGYSYINNEKELFFRFLE